MIRRLLILALALLFSSSVLAQSVTVSPTIPVGQIPGTTTNDNANAGNVGQYLESTCSVLSLSTGAGANCGTLSLTAGDWDVEFDASYAGNAATTFTYMASSVSTTSATLNSTAGNLSEVAIGSAMTFTASGLTPTTNSGTVRTSLATTTSYYGVCQASFAVNTATCSGILRARRVR